MQAEQGSPQNLGEQELKFGYWYTTHKLLLRRIFIIALILFSLPFYIYSLYHAVDYFFLSGVRERAEFLEFTRSIDYTLLHESYQPIAISLGRPEIFGGTRDRYDLIANAENKNKNWHIEFDYVFVGPGFTSQPTPGFLLPGEKRILTILGAPSGSRPRNLQLQLQNVKWRRINKHEISDVESFTEDRTNFEIANAKFTPAVSRDTVVVSKAEFTITNRTAFSFWRVDFLVLLTRGSRVQAINLAVAEGLRAGETRNLEVSWFETIPAVDKVEIKPILNIFDESVYMR